MKVIGIKSLLDIDPMTVYKNFSICSKHFKDGSFLNSETKDRIRNDAVPSESLEQPAFDESVMEEFFKSLNSWEGTYILSKESLQTK